MYAANMSWKPVQEVLSRLVEEGLIEVSRSINGQSRKRYNITEKGSQVLIYFNDAKDLMQFDGIFTTG